MITLAEIESQVNALAERIGATPGMLPTYGRTEDGARPHIEVDARGMHVVVVERGVELARQTTQNVDELLWFVFDDVASDVAGKYEMKHRERGRDFRRVRFAKQVEILTSLSPAWGDRTRARLDEVLAQHPFDDASDSRVNLAVSFRANGQSAEAAWISACERYPLPQPVSSPDARSGTSP